MTGPRLFVISGPSGSGKSTLAKLMQGFYQPSDGAILIDERDIRHFSANDLRSHYGVVPQETRLFAGSIFDNASAIAFRVTDHSSCGSISTQLGRGNFHVTEPRPSEIKVPSGVTTTARQLLEPVSIARMKLLIGRSLACPLQSSPSVGPPLTESRGTRAMPRSCEVPVRYGQRPNRGVRQ